MLIETTKELQNQTERRVHGFQSQNTTKTPNTANRYSFNQYQN